MTKKRLIYAEDLELFVNSFAVTSSPDLNKMYARVNATCMAAIKAVPTIDAVEVVRCKDCIHATRLKRMELVYCEVFGRHFMLNEFCSEGCKNEDT